MFPDTDHPWQSVELAKLFRIETGAVLPPTIHAKTSTITASRLGTNWVVPQWNWVRKLEATSSCLTNLRS